ncbi:MAG TPA: helix-turn-helix transcriptional regulator, partial [Gemmatimonadales bacterium]|nr:helix-turn-helix transcriptional regulator [Gemmatimonadales bacterium]
PGEAESPSPYPSDMAVRPALGEFLRTRRGLLSPADVGLPTGERQRDNGLRREEVAVLAGISSEYYLRLEQGREHNPSEKVLEGIARALKLNDDAVAYMRNLVREQHGPDHAAVTLNPAIDALMASWPLAAAHVHDQGLTVVSANALARALSPHYDRGSNTLRALFLEPEMRRFYRNWEKLTVWTVRLVRTFAGRDPNRQLLDLVAELRCESPTFRELWDRQEVKYAGDGLMMIDHPLVGPLDLHFQHLALPGTGHTLVAYWADPGSPSEQGLRNLSER